MDFRKFEYIISLAETQSITKTAEKMFISPSALSQSLSSIEKELGTSLFKRTKGAWPLTEAGRIYLNTAQNIIQRFEQMKKNINDVISCERGNISIGISTNKASLMFASVFPLFKERYPNIKIKLSEGRNQEIISMTEKGLLDIAFATTGIDCSGLTYQTLLHERFVLSLPKTHHLARLTKDVPVGKLATVDLGLFKEEQFILTKENTTLRILTDKMFAQAGFKPKNIFESSSYWMFYTLVDSSYGISIIPMGNINPNSSHVVNFLTTPSGEWDNIIAYNKATKLSQAEKYFISLSEEFFKTRYGSIS